MNPKRPQHPSGRPIRRDEFKRPPYPRVPCDEPLTPRLRQPWPLDAIGFVHSFDAEGDDDE